MSTSQVTVPTYSSVGSKAPLRPDPVPGAIGTFVIHQRDCAPDVSLVQTFASDVAELLSDAQIV